MKKEEFVRLVTKVAKECGFSKKGNNFYYDFGNDIVSVLGLQKSLYGAYYYVEYGYAILSLNPRAPYPKFSDLNVNFGRIMFPFNKEVSTMVEYETINEIDTEVIVSTLRSILKKMVETGINGKTEIAKVYYNNISYVIGASTIEYLNIPKGEFSVLSEKIWG